MPEQYQECERLPGAGHRDGPAFRRLLRTAVGEELGEVFRDGLGKTRRRPSCRYLRYFQVDGLRAGIFSQDAGPGVPLPSVLTCCVPYRVNISSPPDDALDHLVHLGALDIELFNDGLAAILPDGVTPDAVVAALGVAGVTVLPAVARDNGSVWLLSPRSVRIGSVLIV